jgi:UDP-2,3-diacylglucosamine hydrolase
VPGAGALYILGDLFESWVGDDGLALPFNARVAQDLARAAKATPVFFMHGNRDFLIARRFAEETGVRLLEDPAIVDLYGTRTLLMHGDTLCTADTQYQAFRAQVRDPRWQQAVLARPLEQRIAMARGLRGESEGAKQGKSMEIMDVTLETVLDAYRKHDASLLIHGHTHRPMRHVHDVDRRERVRWVLPDWYDERAGYLEVTPQSQRFIAIT